MSETGNTEESYEVSYRRRQTHTDRSIKALEAISLFPETGQGLEASETVMDLLDKLHETRLDGIESIFTSIRLIFQTFNITLDI